jgi:ABC-2 type transport system ATP-binding protein
VESLVLVDRVTKRYGKTLAVADLSFGVAKGEVLGFLGPNGAGKSTTIKILIGRMHPQAGTARVLGTDVTADDPAMQARIGVCFEEKNLYDSMSAEENLRFFASLFGIRRLDTGALLSRVGLADRARDRVSKYSKGMRQRLMVARALVNAPDVLFLDEPTDGLDPVSSTAIRRLITEEAARGAAVLLTTHDMHEADELSDRVAFINEGTLYALDTPESLKLRHGTRSARVQVRQDGDLVERRVDLDADGAEEALRAALSAPELVTVHTDEASLEAIFIEMTGRQLDG